MVWFGCDVDMMVVLVGVSVFLSVFLSLLMFVSSCFSVDLAVVSSIFVSGASSSVCSSALIELLMAVVDWSVAYVGIVVVCLIVVSGSSVIVSVLLSSFFVDSFSVGLFSVSSFSGDFVSSVSLSAVLFDVCTVILLSSGCSLVVAAVRAVQIDGFVG